MADDQCCKRPQASEVKGSDQGLRLVGGVSRDIQPADKHVQDMVDSLKGEIGSNYKEVTAVSYATQVVAGLNYFVKVKAITKDGKEDILHLRIYKHFKNPAALTSVKKDVTLETPIEHF